MEDLYGAVANVGILIKSSRDIIINCRCDSWEVGGISGMMNQSSLQHDYLITSGTM